MTRTDVHRPSVIVPDDYEFVACGLIRVEGIEDVAALKVEREILHAHMLRTAGGYSDHAHGGNCMVCGNAFAIYTMIFYHHPTNTYVRVGGDCARKLEMGGEARLNAFTASVRDARAAQAGKAKAQALLTDAGLERAYTLYASMETEGERNEERTVRDIVARLVRYGSVSDRQLAFVRTLLDRIDRRAEIAAQRAAEAAAAAPCPTGRVEITGRVVSVKTVESDFSRFGVMKMLVKADAGFKVWGTVPDRALDGEGELRGARITIRATVTPSKDDAKFGFFKRPLLVSIDKGDM